MLPTLYKRDSQGRVRSWRVEVDGSRFRTVAGLIDGAQVESGWTSCIGKQGRTDEEQAVAEAKSAWTFNVEREYHECIEDIDKPKFFKPMLAKAYEAWSGPAWVQPKLDGIRCIATSKGLFSRQGKPIVSVPHIYAALKPLFDQDEDLILDGEIYADRLKDDFQTLISLAKKQKPTDADLEASKVLEYHIYDIPSCGHLAFTDRVQVLRSLSFLSLVGDPPLRRVSTVWAEDEDELRGYHAGFIQNGYEGTMIRSPAGAYEQKRSSNLLKFKSFDDGEFPVVSIEEGNGNWAGLAKRVIIRLPDGSTCGAGIRGTQERAAQLLAEPGKWKTATVRYFGKTDDGKLRFPVVTALFEGERDL